MAERVAAAAGEAAGVTPQRLSGPDRYGTSAAVVTEALARGADASKLWLATGGDWPDALAAGPAIAQRRGVLALAPPAGPTASSDTAALVEGLRPGLRRVVLVGGRAAIADVATAQTLGGALEEASEG